MRREVQIGGTRYVGTDKCAIVITTVAAVIQYAVTIPRTDRFCYSFT